MPPGRGAFGWAVFYQAVNIGGFIGPLVAALLQALEWKYVFLICAAGIALNFIPLFLFAEPKRKEGEGFEGASPMKVLSDSLMGMLKPRVFLSADYIPTVNGGNLNQAWMININALMISFFAFAFGWLTGKVRSVPAMVIGILISCVAIYMLGMSMNGWWTLFAIGIFSIGEMTASPTKLRFMAEIAPAGKKGLFLGYANATVGIGWATGSWVAGSMYEEGGDKVNLAKKYLVEESGVAQTTVDALQKTEVLPALEAQLGQSSEQVRQLLWDTYQPYDMWLTFALVGLGSMTGLIIYDRIVRQYDAAHPAEAEGGASE
jgi:dipeptide/tripeptide permease